MNDKPEYPRAVFARAPWLRDTSEAVRNAYLEIIDTVYFASLMPEEGAHVPIGVVVDLEDRLEKVVDSSSWPDPRDGSGWFVWRMNSTVLTPHALKKLSHGTQYGRDLIVVTMRDSQFVMTGIARRQPHTDGGAVVRIAAPLPGVLVLEGQNRQLGVRYEAGRELPLDVEVFQEEGLVLEALRACGLDDHRWRLAETIRHARAAQAGAMFLCLPKSGGFELPSNAPARRFDDPNVLERLAREERELSLHAVSLARVSGSTQPEDQADAYTEVEWEREAVHAESLAFIEMLGRLAAIDGAVVIRPGFRVAAVGYIIGDIPVTEGEAQHPKPWECRDAQGKKTVERVRTGGARHAAAFRFAWAVRGAVVFVVSADGPVTCALRRGDELLTWSVRVPET